MSDHGKLTPDGAPACGGCPLCAAEARIDWDRAVVQAARLAKHLKDIGFVAPELRPQRMQEIAHEWMNCGISLGLLEPVAARTPEERLS